MQKEKDSAHEDKSLCTSFTQEWDKLKSEASIKKTYLFVISFILCDANVRDLTELVTSAVKKKHLVFVITVIPLIQQRIFSFTKKKFFFKIYLPKDGSVHTEHSNKL